MVSGKGMSKVTNLHTVTIYHSTMGIHTWRIQGLEESLVLKVAIASEGIFAFQKKNPLQKLNI